MTAARRRRGPAAGATLPAVGAFVPPGNLNGEAELDIRHALAITAYFRALRQPAPPDSAAFWRWMRGTPDGQALREALLAHDAAILEHGPRLPVRRP